MATRRFASELSRGFLAEARRLWREGDAMEATERATRVFLVEGREVFGAADQPLFDAMLARLRPPAGFKSWAVYFEAEAVRPRAKKKEKTDAQIIEEINTRRGRTPLHDAATKGDLKKVEALLAKGADLNAVFQQGALQWTPLCAAVLDNHLPVIERLLAAGARVSGRGISNALFTVQSVAAALALIDAGARVDDEADSSGRTLLARVVDVAGPVELCKLIASLSPRHSALQREVLQRAAKQTTAANRRVVAEFLAKTT